MKGGLIYRPDCKFTPEMVELLKKKTPTATIITEVGEEGKFNTNECSPKVKFMFHEKLNLITRKH